MISEEYCICLYQNLEQNCLCLKELKFDTILKIGIWNKLCK